MENEKSPLLPNKKAENLEAGNDEKSSHFHLELPYFLVVFAHALVSSTVPNHLLNQTCLFKGFNISECSKMVINNQTRNSIEEIVQPQVASVMMTISVFNSVVPGILTIFLGSWSDKVGRKKVILASFCGFSIGYALLAGISIISKYQPLNPWINVAAYIPIVLTGSGASLILSSLCYITDITTEKNRSFRLTVIEVSTFVAFLSGTSLSSYILSMTSSSGVFLISSSFACFATVYSMCFISESIQVPKNFKLYLQVKELLSMKPVSEMLSVSVRRRPFNERKTLWCLIVILILNHFAVNGTSTVFYLFVREKFKWGLRDETLFLSLSYVVLIVACFAGMTAFKRLKISDISIAGISIFSILFDSVVKLTATSSKEMYFTSGVAMFKILLVPTCRSTIASFILKTEVGKIFTITSALEAVLSMFSSPLYTFVYANTFTFFAGAFYLITISVCLVNLSLVCIVRRMLKVREALINKLDEVKTKVEDKDCLMCLIT